MSIDRQKSPKLAAALFVVAYGVSTLIGCTGSKDQKIIGPSGPGLPPVPTAPKSAKEKGFSPEANEIRLRLNYGDMINIGGKMEFRGESRLVDLSLVMSRISDQIGTEAGLLQLNQPLTLKVVDIPAQPGSTGAETYFNPQTKSGISEIVVPYFLATLDKEARLPNSPLVTEERRREYLSVLLSKAALVEISDQAHMQNNKSPLDQTVQDRIDSASNQLGSKYVRQIMDGLAQPFVIVDKIN